MTSGSALGGIDDALVLRCQAGDPVATGELVRLARPILQRYARRFFPDPARAEDMAQTALMKAFARMGDLRSPEAFQTWLLRITRNECLNELTRHRVAQIPMSTLEDQGTALEAPAGGADDPEEMLVRSQMAALVRRVTATLPPHYRSTLTMRALEDRSYEEISAELDIPVTVARLWYCRARKRFRTAFIQALVARRDVPDTCQEMGSAIAELIEGTLARAKRDSVQEHLSGCAACRQTEDELRNTAFRAPARAMLFALALARAPMSLRRSVSGFGARTQQLAGELALGAAGTLVLATTGGLGTAPPAVVQAAGPSGSLAPALALPFVSENTAGTAADAPRMRLVAMTPQGDAVVVPAGADDATSTVVDPGLGTPLGPALPVTTPSPRATLVGVGGHVAKLPAMVATTTATGATELEAAVAATALRVISR
jgi:RNA polymerase sigma factor (sigma-70 family)